MEQIQVEQEKLGATSFPGILSETFRGDFFNALPDEEKPLYMESVRQNFISSNGIKEKDDIDYINRKAEETYKEYRQNFNLPRFTPNPEQASELYGKININPSDPVDKRIQSIEDWRDNVAPSNVDKFLPANKEDVSFHIEDLANNLIKSELAKDSYKPGGMPDFLTDSAKRFTEQAIKGLGVDLLADYKEANRFFAKNLVENPEFDNDFTSQVVGGLGNVLSQVALSAAATAAGAPELVAPMLLTTSTARHMTEAYNRELKRTGNELVATDAAVNSITAGIIDAGPEILLGGLLNKVKGFSDAYKLATTEAAKKAVIKEYIPLATKEFVKQGLNEGLLGGVGTDVAGNLGDYYATGDEQYLKNATNIGELARSFAVEGTVGAMVGAGIAGLTKGSNQANVSATIAQLTDAGKTVSIADTKAKEAKIFEAIKSGNYDKAIEIANSNVTAKAPDKIIKGDTKPSLDPSGTPIKDKAEATLKERLGEVLPEQSKIRIANKPYTDELNKIEKDLDPVKDKDKLERLKKARGLFEKINDDGTSAGPIAFQEETEFESNDTNFILKGEDKQLQTKKPFDVTLNDDTKLKNDNVIYVKQEGMALVKNANLIKALGAPVTLQVTPNRRFVKFKGLAKRYEASVNPQVGWVPVVVTGNKIKILAPVKEANEIAAKEPAEAIDPAEVKPKPSLVDDSEVIDNKDKVEFENLLEKKINNTITPTELTRYNELEKTQAPAIEDEVVTPEKFNRVQEKLNSGVPDGKKTNVKAPDKLPKRKKKKAETPVEETVETPVETPAVETTTGSNFVKKEAVETKKGKWEVLDENGKETSPYYASHKSKEEAEDFYEWQQNQVFYHGQEPGNYGHYDFISSKGSNKFNLTKASPSKNAIGVIVGEKNPWQRGEDGILDTDNLLPGNHGYIDVNGKQELSKPTIVHKNGWTALAFVDRTSDKRTGAHGAFFTHGTLSIEEMLDRVDLYFPGLVENKKIRDQVNLEKPEPVLPTIETIDQINETENPNETIESIDRALELQNEILSDENISESKRTQVNKNIAKLEADKARIQPTVKPDQPAKPIDRGVLKQIISFAEKGDLTIAKFDNWMSRGFLSEANLPQLAEMYGVSAYDGDLGKFAQSIQTAIKKGKEKAPKQTVEQAIEETIAPVQDNTQEQQNKKPLIIEIPKDATQFKEDSIAFALDGIPNNIANQFTAHGTNDFSSVVNITRKGPKGEIYTGKLKPDNDGNPWGNTKTGSRYLIITKAGVNGISSKDDISVVVVNNANPNDVKYQNGTKAIIEKSGIKTITALELPEWIKENSEPDIQIILQQEIEQFREESQATLAKQRENNDENISRRKEQTDRINELAKDVGLKNLRIVNTHEELNREEIDDSVQGFIEGSNVTLILDNIIPYENNGETILEATERIFKHEVVGHLKISQVLNGISKKSFDDLADFLKKLKWKDGTNIWESTKAAYTIGNVEPDIFEMVDEVIAKITEGKNKESMSLLSRIAAKIKIFLLKNGLTGNWTINDLDIVIQTAFNSDADLSDASGTIRFAKSHQSVYMDSVIRGYGAWIAPNGKIIDVGYQDHLGKAIDIIGEEAIEGMTVTQVYAEMAKRGYLRVINGSSILVDEQYKLNSSQKAVLEFAGINGDKNVIMGDKYLYKTPAAMRFSRSTNQFDFRLADQLKDPENVMGLVIAKDGTLPAQNLTAKIKKSGATEFEVDTLTQLVNDLSKDGRVNMSELSEVIDTIPTVVINKLSLTETESPDQIRFNEIKHELDSTDFEFGFTGDKLKILVRKEGNFEFIDKEQAPENIRKLYEEALNLKLGKDRSNAPATGKYGVDPYSNEQLKGEEIEPGHKLIWSGDLSLNIPVDVTKNSFEFDNFIESNDKNITLAKKILESESLNGFTESELNKIINGTGLDINETELFTEDVKELGFSNIVSKEENPKFTSQHYKGDVAKNQLAFVRGGIHEYQTGNKLPDGTTATKPTRILEIWEVQSDWAGRVANQGSKENVLKGILPKGKEFKQRKEDGRWFILDNDSKIPKETWLGFDDKQELLENYANSGMMQESSPLLNYWESLALKAAVNFAQEQGADKIITSDAETAMMTEGHDANSIEYTIKPTESGINSIKDNISKKGRKPHTDYVDIILSGEEYKTTSKVIANWANAHNLNVSSVVNDPSQAPGMKAAYDERVPNGLKKLTNSQPKKVTVGKHGKGKSEVFNKDTNTGYMFSVPQNRGLLRFSKSQPNNRLRLDSVGQKYNNWISSSRAKIETAIGYIDRSNPNTEEANELKKEIESTKFESIKEEMDLIKSTDFTSVSELKSLLGNLNKNIRFSKSQPKQKAPVTEQTKEDNDLDWIVTDNEIITQSKSKASKEIAKLIKRTHEQKLIIKEIQINNAFKNVNYAFLNDSDVESFLADYSDFVNTRNKQEDPATERIPVDVLEQRLIDYNKKANKNEYEFYASRVEGFPEFAFFKEDAGAARKHFQDLIQEKNDDLASVVINDSDIATMDAVVDLQFQAIEAIDDISDVINRGVVDMESSLVETGNLILDSGIPILREQVAIMRKLFNEHALSLITTDATSLSGGDLRRVYYSLLSLVTDGYPNRLEGFISSETTEILRDMEARFRDPYGTKKKNSDISKLESNSSQIERLATDGYSYDLLTRIQAPFREGLVLAKRYHEEVITPYIESLQRDVYNGVLDADTGHKIGMFGILRQRKLVESPEEGFKASVQWVLDSNKNTIGVYDRDFDAQGKRHQEYLEDNFLSGINYTIENGQLTSDFTPEDVAKFYQNANIFIGDKGIQYADGIVKMYDALKPLSKFTTEFIYGRPFEEIENYIPSMSVIIKGEGDTDFDIAKAQMLTDAQSFSSGQIFYGTNTTGLGSTKSRTRKIGTNRSLVFNINYAGESLGRIAVYDYFTAHARQEMSQLLNHKNKNGKLFAKFLGDPEQKRGRTDAFRSAMNGTWQNVMSQASYMHSYHVATNWFGRKFSQAVLSGFHQLPAQLVSNTTPYFVQHINEPHKIGNYFKAATYLLKHRMGMLEPHQMRLVEKVIFEVTHRQQFQEIDKSVNLDINPSSLVEMMKKEMPYLYRAVVGVDKGIENILFKAFRLSDTLSGAPMVLAEYLNAEQDSKGTHVRIEDLTYDPVSYIKAIDATERYIGIGDASRRGEYLTNKDAKISIGRNLLIAFRSFSLNNAVNFGKELIRLFDSNVSREQKAQSFKYMMGIAAQSVTYTMMAYAVQYGMAAAIAHALKNPEEEEELKKLYSKSQNRMTKNERRMLNAEISMREKNRKVIQNIQNRTNNTRILSIKTVKDAASNMFIPFNLEAVPNIIIHVGSDGPEAETFKAWKKGEIDRIQKLIKRHKALENRKTVTLLSEELANIQMQEFLPAVYEQRTIANIGGSFGGTVEGIVDAIESGSKFFQKPEAISPLDFVNLAAVIGVSQPDIKRYFRASSLIEKSGKEREEQLAAYEEETSP